MPVAVPLSPLVQDRSRNSIIHLVDNVSSHRKTVTVLHGTLDQSASIVVTLDKRLSSISPAMQAILPLYTPTGHGTRVYSATAKSAPSAWGNNVCVKIAHGSSDVNSLMEEVACYDGALRSLWDVAVPRVHGVFVTPSGTYPQACLILELCHDTKPAIDRNEFHRLAILAMCKVHQAGLKHGQYINDCGQAHQYSFADYRHFVVKGKRVFLVDFSCARRHECHGPGVPQLHDCSHQNAPHACWELQAIEAKFGFRS